MSKTLAKMTTEQLNEELEKIDVQRQEALTPFKEKGRVVKAEIDRRNMEETLVSKIARQLPLTESQNKTFQGMPKAEQKRITKLAVTKLQQRMKEMQANVDGEE